MKPRPAKTQKDLLHVYGSKTLGTFVQIFNCQNRLYLVKMSDRNTGPKSQSLHNNL